MITLYTMAKLIIICSLILTNLVFLAHSYFTPTMFIFGDSIFDAGNNHFVKNCTVQADFAPYGLDYFHHPTGRFTNGRTVVDFLAEYLGIEYQPPFEQVQIELRNGTRKTCPSHGINFASAGSGVLQDTNKNMGVTPIQVQLQLFQQLIQQNQIDIKLVQNSLFLLESGSNDIFNYFLLFPPPNLEPNEYIQAMLAEVQSFVNKIYDLGARRIAIFSLGPVGCAPGRAVLPQAPLNKCFGRMNKMTKQYNFGLEKIVNDITDMPGAAGAYGDVYRIIQQFRATPTRYGFHDVTRACCGNGPLGGTIQCGKEGYMLCSNPKKFLFWDYFHPSERTCRLAATYLWRGGPREVRPLNLKTLATLAP